MSNFKITTPIIGAQPISETSTTKRHDLGTIVTARDDIYGVGEFVYALGVADTVVGSWVTLLADGWTTALTVADAIGPVGVAMSINVANQYGWYQISGKAVGKAASGYADNALVYLTATPGVVDDTVVAGDKMRLAQGASAVGTPSAGLAEFEIHRPFVDDINDAA